MEFNDEQKEEIIISSQNLNEDRRSFKTRKLLFIFLGVILSGAFVFELAGATGMKLISKFADIGNQVFHSSGEFKFVGSAPLGEKNNLEKSKENSQENSAEFSVAEKKSKKKTSGAGKNKKSNNNLSKAKDDSSNADLEKINNNDGAETSLILNNNASDGASGEISKKYFTLTVSKFGNGNGSVADDNGKIDCGNKCSNDYLKGTKISLNIAHASDSYFIGWGGACNGNKNCSVVLNDNTYVSANFGLNSADNSQIASGNNFSGNNQSASTQNNDIGGGNNGSDNLSLGAVAGISHLVVSEIFVGMDGNANYEFIELYNPTNQNIDLTGWSIKKKSSSGAESSLVVSSRLDGKKIFAGKYFLIANEGGYNGAVNPDAVWAKSNTLAYTNNAIVVYNNNGEAVEQVNWTEIPKNESFERVLWDSSQFKIETNPNPQNSNSN